MIEMSECTCEPNKPVRVVQINTRVKILICVNLEQLGVCFTAILVDNLSIMS